MCRRKPPRLRNPPQNPKAGRKICLRTLYHLHQRRKNHRHLSVGQIFFEGFAKPEDERSREVQRLLGKSLISTAVSSKNTNLRHFTAKTLTSPTRRLSSFSGSLSSTSGTSTTVPYEKRTEWNAPADPDYALPTEIWRETVARRQRYQTVRAKLANGEIYNINDLITYKVVYDEFYPRHSKRIIDKIDRVLAEHYGFTDEELDFIINYDIKYRMGLEK